MGGNLFQQTPLVSRHNFNYENLFSSTERSLFLAGCAGDLCHTRDSEDRNDMTIYTEEPVLAYNSSLQLLTMAIRKTAYIIYIYTGS